MTTQDILNRVNTAIAEFDAHLTCRQTLADLRDDLESKLRHEIAKQDGTLNAARIIERILGTSLKEKRHALAFPWIDGESRQCISDGFRAFRLRNHLPLPERPDNIGAGIDLDKIFPKSTNGMKSLRMPTVNELREFIALEKAKFTGKRKDFSAMWDFGSHAPTVNAEYLLDAATVFPNATTIFWNTLVSPLYITDESGDALLLPIRDMGKTQEPPANDDERKAIEAENARTEANRKESAERSNAILKAHEDYDDAYGALKDALQQQKKASDNMSAAQTEAEYNAAFEQWCDACEHEAAARLRGYAAESVFNYAVSLSTYEFEHLIRTMYIRDYAMTNVA